MKFFETENCWNISVLFIIDCLIHRKSPNIYCFCGNSLSFPLVFNMCMELSIHLLIHYCMERKLASYLNIPDILCLLCLLSFFFLPLAIKFIVNLPFSIFVIILTSLFWLLLCDFLMVTIFAGTNRLFQILANINCQLLLFICNALYMGNCGKIKKKVF